MSKIGIVLDPHITDRHRCRSDNFLEVALKKLDYVASNNDYVIICGDLFHTNTNSHLIFNKVYKLFTKHKGKFFTIPGNHDLLHNNISMLEKTTIGSLALTGALNLEFDKFKIDNAEFQVSLVMKDLDKIPKDESNTKILIGHNYMEPVGVAKEWFTRDEIKQLNYRVVFLGHDHQPHETEYLGNSALIRMGSLTRIDTQPYNKEREIFYYQLDSNTLEYEKKEVPHKKAEEIYTVEAFQRIGRKKEDISFIKIGEILSKFKKRDNVATSLHARLKAVASDEEIDYIKAMHELNGIRYF